MNTPFNSPPPKGEPPYWLRARDESMEALHLRLIREMERLVLPRGKQA